MIRHRLVASGQPRALRALFGLVEFLASAAMATVVIAAGAIVLAWATWLEHRWGGPAVQWGVYQSNWFAALLAVLGVNVAAAALIRFPWRREKTGFVIVHAGILVLLVGCWISREKSIHGQMSLFEGESSSRAIDERREIELTVDRSDGGDDRRAAETIPIAFEPGVFHWSDVDAMGWFPWRLARRDRGVLYDNDGVRVEAIDYLADSRRMAVPRLKLRVAAGDASGPRDARAARSLTLAVREFSSPGMGHPAVVVGSRERLAGGASIVFRLSGGKEETEAFLSDRPEGALGRLGQIVLRAKGKRYRFLVQDLLEKGPVAMGESGLRVELMRFDPVELRVLVKVDAAGDEQSKGVLLLSAVGPELDQQDGRNGVVGSYWYASSGEPAKLDTAPSDEKEASKKDAAKEAVTIPPAAAHAAAEPRVDILLGQDERLYCRTWRDGRVETLGELKRSGASTVAFADTESSMTLSVESLVPAAKAGYQIIAVPFDKEKPTKRERVKVRLTVDGESGEFWLGDPLAGEGEHPASVRAKGRAATVRMSRRQIDLGFEVRLDGFECRFDPGTSRASHYESRVGFLAVGAKAHPLEEDVVIALNRPARCVDPASGRMFRFFQGGYGGPYGPGQSEFDDRGDSVGRRNRLYRSDLIVTCDPGRSLKYAGCLMIVAGIVVMYYMKAYFFRPRGKPE